MRLDGAINAAAVAKANLEVAKKQYELTKAGAWIYDIQNQERQQHALEKAYASSSALLGKYTLARPRDGVVLSINTIVGNYASPQGSYDSIHAGPGSRHYTWEVLRRSLHVRCYVDEILVPRLPAGSKIKAQMSIRGVGRQDSAGLCPGAAVRFSEDRAFGSTPGTRGCAGSARDLQDREAANVNLYPGELVDVYISE